MKFAEARAELASIANGEYRSISYELSEDGSASRGKTTCDCSVYVHSFGWHKEPTWRSALDKLRARMGTQAVDDAEAPKTDDGHKSTAGGGHE